MSNMKTKLSSRGQVVIPADLRRELDLERGTRFELDVEEGRIVLTPIRDEDWRSYRGFLEDGPSLTDALEEERQKERQREEAKMNER